MVPDCRLPHQARIEKSEVLQHGINQAQWRITAEETMLETREEGGRDREGFVSKRRAEHAEATLLVRDATEVRTVSHLP